MHLPIEPPAGPGAVLLGGIVANYAAELDRDTLRDVQGLATDLENGLRIVQPRVRYRLQVDRVGLLQSRHELVRVKGRPQFRFSGEHGAPIAHVLASVYAAGQMAPATRRTALDVVRRALEWTGPIDEHLIEGLAGDVNSSTWQSVGHRDPKSWALDLLGFDPDGDAPDKKSVQLSFRNALREAHPDHGGESDDAADRIADLREARRILS